MRTSHLRESAIVPREHAMTPSRHSCNRRAFLSGGLVLLGSTLPKGPRQYLDLLFWISFATLTGLPATTAPIGLTRDGLPVGIQIIGPYLEDATPIDLAGKLVDVIGGFRPPKGY